MANGTRWRGLTPLSFVVKDSALAQQITVLQYLHPGGAVHRTGSHKIV
jgi:hypothetical protein